MPLDADQGEAAPPQNAMLSELKQRNREGGFPISQRCGRMGPRSQSMYARIGKVYRTELKSEAYEPIANRSDAEHHHVHHHGVGNIFGPCKTGFNQSKAGLHKKDQKTGNEHPHDVNAFAQFLDFRSAALG
jgi:hypothetical protein